jgi:carboxylesterase type B
VGVLVVESILEFGEQFSEDCLTLNVWTAPQKGERKKAVLVWIYGGGFTTGSSAAPLYNGQHLADLEDVVVVTIKYVIALNGSPDS